MLGRIHVYREELESASKAFDEALNLCEEWNTHLIAGRILLDWASVESSRGAEETAASKLERAAEIFETAQAEYWVDRTRAALDELAREEVSQDS